MLCWNVTAKEYYIDSILSNTKQMTVLNLAGTKTKDKTLQTIAKNCSNIRELDVSDCFDVTDTGVAYLCGENEYPDVPCRSLVKLNLAGTKVGRQGVIMALRKLKGLQFLEHEWLWEILSQMHTQYEPGHHVEDNQQFQLKKMTFLGGFEPAFILRAVDIMCGFCPWLAAISIFGCGFDDQCLFRLSRLKCLKKFRLDDQRNMVTFRWGLLPFLHACGEGLLELTLINVKDVNVAAIAAHCPNLETMNLVDMSSTTTAGFTCNHPFQHLRHLEMRQHQIDCTSEEAIKYLLAYSHKLEYISFFNITSLYDSVLHDILQTNSLSCLEHISLCRCHGITAKSIIRLIGGADVLKIVHLRECNSIAYGRRPSIMNFIKENNFDVNIF